MSRPLLLDLYCKQGGASKGYADAGFDVVGVDIEPQPHYPFPFIQADALKILELWFTDEWVASDRVRYASQDFDAIHASPPCLFAQHLNHGKRAVHKNLIPVTRAGLKATRLPFVIENVPAARWHLNNPIKLCGTMFGLGIHRHRYFEMWPVTYYMTPTCQHIGHPVLISGVSRIKGQPRKENSAAECRNAAGLDWMTREGMDQAVPPAFTEYIGKHLIQALTAVLG